MTDFVALFLTALVTASAFWAVVLFVLSPALMGDEAPEYAKALWRAFEEKPKLRIIRVSLADGQLVLASALLLAPPTIVSVTGAPVVSCIITEDMRTASTSTIEMGVIVR